MDDMTADLIGEGAPEGLESVRVRGRGRSAASTELRALEARRM
ncbi:MULTISPECIES: hypothetical protein [Nocardia]|nr:MULTISPECIES: hypothetical protein [Nocardia]